jgi:hypothetical protein
MFHKEGKKRKNKKVCQVSQQQTMVQGGVSN